MRRLRCLRVLLSLRCVEICAVLVRLLRGLLHRVPFIAASCGYWWRLSLFCCKNPFSDFRDSFHLLLLRVRHLRQELWQILLPSILSAMLAVRVLVEELIGRFPLCDAVVLGRVN